MEKFLLSFLLLIASLCESYASQSMKHFKCDLFSFDYPSYYKTEPITNAPHMRMNVSCPKYMFTGSYWDKEFEPNTSIWDNDIFEGFASASINGKIIGVEKITLNTKSGKRRAIRLKSILTQGSIPMNAITYYMIKDVYLFVFCFFSYDSDIFSPSCLSYQENFFKGLSFTISNTQTAGDNEFYSYLLEAVKKLNAQCPYKTDEITTYRNIVLSGKTVCAKVTIADEAKDIIDFDLLKTEFCQNFMKAVPKNFFESLNEKGFSISYLIYDEEESLIKVLTISPKDVLKYYD